MAREAHRIPGHSRGFLVRQRGNQITVIHATITTTRSIDLTSIIHYLALTGVRREAMTKVKADPLMLHAAGLVLRSTESDKCRKMRSYDGIGVLQMLCLFDPMNRPRPRLGGKKQWPKTWSNCCALRPLNQTKRLYELSNSIRH